MHTMANKLASHQILLAHGLLYITDHMFLDKYLSIEEIITYSWLLNIDNISNVNDTPPNAPIFDTPSIFILNNEIDKICENIISGTFTLSLDRTIKQC